MYYYFEPLASVYHETELARIVGESVVTVWDESRRNEIGIYNAYQTDYPKAEQYGYYSNFVEGNEWNRYEAGETMPNGITLEYPAYYQYWIVRPRTEAELEEVFIDASDIVASEVEKRLTRVAAWVTAKRIIDTHYNINSRIDAYCIALLSIKSNPAFPYGLADSLNSGTYEGWPTDFGSSELMDINAN